jgi:hypothetical protein
MANILQSEHEVAEERMRVLQMISQRWNGNLQAYLEAIARVRTVPVVREPRRREHEAAVESLLRVSRRS